MLGFCGRNKNIKYGRRIKIDSNSSRGALPDGYTNGLTAPVALELAHAPNFWATHHWLLGSSWVERDK